MNWSRLLRPLLAPLGQRLARWLFEDDGKSKSLERQLDDRMRQRKGTAVGEAYRRASREAGKRGAR